MVMPSAKYYSVVDNMLKKIYQTQAIKINEAAKIIADKIANGGMIYIFGCGHSHLVSLDCFYRAGGLACVSPILDSGLMLHEGAVKSSVYEKLEGLAQPIFERYDITSADIMVIVSTSGINSVPVQMAEIASERGITTIGITSSAYFTQKPRYREGKMLYQAVDICIDNCVPLGDAAVDIGDGNIKAGPVSTIASSFIMQSILLNSIYFLSEQGIDPPIYCSSNLMGGAEHNRSMISSYKSKIKHL
ncbi:MAG TPA: SIS domain-containing protein [Clostridia bacterium]